MIRIALVGSIGSGKTFISKLFGYPVFNADDSVSKIYSKNKEYIDLSFAAGSLILGHNSKTYISAIKNLILSFKIFKLSLIFLIFNFTIIIFMFFF